MNAAKAENVDPHREHELAERADVVVIGSGFGGSVAAYRLAAAGLSVVVLERGRAYPPGSFPRNPDEMSRAFWDPKEHLYGMYDVWSFSGCDSLVSSGLGGGSLIYASVLLRKDEKWFVNDEPLPGGGSESWPVTRADLDPHYDAVERMLGATPFPLGHPAYADSPRTIALRDAAAELGLDWQLPPLAVSFAPSPGARPGQRLPIATPEYGNLHGVPRMTCRQAGECDMGCNEGAKNTLDHTYLSAASHHGADLRTLHEAKEIFPLVSGGYGVRYKRHDESGASGTIGCKRLILAAGTFGTTKLLLRSRDNLPGLSNTLGSRFSGNGDLLMLLLRATDRSGTQPLNSTRGPVITSAIRLADGLDGPQDSGRGAYIQDGGYPAFVAWLVKGTDVGHNVGRAARFLVDWLRALLTNDTNLSAEVAALFGGGRLASGTLPLLGMGRDVPDGQLLLRGRRLDVTWSAKASKEHFDRVRATMRRISDVLGTERSSLLSWLEKRFVTVHPLGGAPMGHHRGSGVCDAFGEVFDHPGLFVADGAALPGPVGPNPSLTIAALADRMATRMLERERPRHPAPRPTSLSFDEEMAGYVVIGASDPHSPEVNRRALGGRLSFQLTIHIDDVDAFVAEPEHLASAEGWVDTALCGGKRKVERGWFNLFSPGSTSDRREMRYRLWFTDGTGQPRTLVGRKDIHGDATQLWHDTTTLYIRLLDGHVEPSKDDLADDAAKVHGAGTLRIEPKGLTETVRSFRTEGPAGIGALVRFGRFFIGELWEVYGPG